jgi:hypothetical protein
MARRNPKHARARRKSEPPALPPPLPKPEWHPLVEEVQRTQRLVEPFKRSIEPGRRINDSAIQRLVNEQQRRIAEEKREASRQREEGRAAILKAAPAPLGDTLGSLLRQALASKAEAAAVSRDGSPPPPPPPLKSMKGTEWFFGDKSRRIRPAHERFPKVPPGQSNASWAHDLSLKAVAEGVALTPGSLVQYMKKL